MFDSPKKIKARQTILALRELYPHLGSDILRGNAAMYDLLITYKEWMELQDTFILATSYHGDGNFYNV